MSLQAGAIVGNNVRLVRPLKRGGMGSVWVAEHLALRTQVAVKFMSERLAQDQEYVARFAREATASAQIKSPHVVQVFDHGLSSDGSPYIVMELLEGEDLRQRLTRVGTIGLDLAAVLVVQIARALSKAHAQGIVHRDIKPDNVFLLEHDGEPFVKLLDFGIAKHTSQEGGGLDGMTGTGAMVGTPHYMSPEQILSARRVDHRADLWSVAVVLYRSLTGQVPFQGETLGAVCIAIERGTFVPPSQRNPVLSPAVDSWFVRALYRDPAARFQSAKEMAEAFVVALSSAGHLPVAPPIRLDTSGTALPQMPQGPSPSGGFYPGAAAPSLTGSQGRMAPLPSLSDAPWASSSVASVPAPHQTFHGASVTQAEWGSSSRRALVAVVSGVLGVVVLLAIVVVMLVRRDAAPAASDKPTEVVVGAPSPSVAPPIVTVAEPALPPSSVLPSASAEAQEQPSKGSSSVKPTTTTTGRPRRDRGF